MGLKLKEKTTMLGICLQYGYSYLARKPPTSHPCHLKVDVLGNTLHRFCPKSQGNILIVYGQINHALLSLQDR